MKIKQEDMETHLSPAEREEEKAPKTLIFVNYKETYLSGGEVCEGQENEAWPSYEDTEQAFDLIGISKENVTPYHQQFLVRIPKSTGQEPWAQQGLWVVVVRYSDGGSFSSTNGYGFIEGVFVSKDEAETVAERLRKGGACRDGYNPWEGYFASLIGVEVEFCRFM